MIKVILFLACSLWSAEDHIVINGQTLHINQDTLYQIAGYTGTIKQHLPRARSSEFTEMYKNSLDFFRAYPKGPGGNFALTRYSDLPSNIDNQVIHKYDLVHMSSNDFIENGKFSVYRYLASTGILKTWVILNFTAHDNAIDQTNLMELIDFYKQSI